MIPAVIITYSVAAVLAIVSGDAAANAITAGLIFLNTCITVWQARHVRNTLEPKVDHLNRVVSTELEQWGGEERRDPNGE